VAPFALATIAGYAPCGASGFSRKPAARRLGSSERLPARPAGPASAHVRRRSSSAFRQIRDGHHCRSRCCALRSASSPWRARRTWPRRSGSHQPIEWFSTRWAANQPQVEGLLTILLVAYQAMKMSGHDWPVISTRTTRTAGAPTRCAADHEMGRTSERACSASRCASPWRLGLVTFRVLIRAKALGLTLIT